MGRLDDKVAVQDPGKKTGLEAQLPGATVLENYSHDFAHPAVCEATAYRQRIVPDQRLQVPL
jgi:hypothetical protein